MVDSIGDQVALCDVAGAAEPKTVTARHPYDVDVHTLLPAVDVAAAHAVRLMQGRIGSEVVTGDPLQAALAFQADGAEWIHLVDLDAAFGSGSNAELLAAVVGTLDVAVELSGGICDDSSLSTALATGCERVVLSTAALADPSWCDRAITEHGDRIAVGMDVRIDRNADGTVVHRLAARGGGDVGELWESLEWLERVGAARYVVTDVSRDGMLDGPNVDLCRAVAAGASASVIASGGISTLADLVGLAELAAEGVGIEGSIVGKALYSGRFTLVEALEAMRRVDMGAPVEG